MTPSPTANPAPSGPPGAVRSSVVLKLAGVTKEFGGVRVLEDLDLELRAGEIHALVGENGSGKLTLVKILAGVYVLDGGVVHTAARDLAPGEPTPSTAFIHQDLGLVPTMTVAENIAAIEGYALRFKLIAWRRVRRQAAQVLRTMGLDVDPSLPLHTLSAAEQSLVAIARALALRPDVLVLDEPTATLPENDVETLFLSLARLRADGLAILYVSHRLDEIYRIADVVTVLRDGRKIFTRPLKEVEPPELVHAITGRRLAEVHPVELKTAKEVVLRLEDVRVGNAGPVSLSLESGEVFALVGLRGAGHESIGRAIFGEVPIRSGMISLRGAPARIRSVPDAIRAGIGLVPGNRHAEALVPGMFVRENLLPNPSGGRWLGGRRERREARALIDRYDIRPSDSERLVDVLSGGNQQKTVCARWIERVGSVLILEEPTSGVDVGAKTDIYRLVGGLLERGVAVLLISADVEEVVRIAGRALIFRDGRPVSEFSRAQITTEGITAAVTGGEHRKVA